MDAQLRDVLLRRLRACLGAEHATRDRGRRRRCLLCRPCTEWFDHEFPPAQVAFLADPLILEFVFGMGIALAYRAGVRLSAAVAALLIVAAIAEMIWSASAWRIELPRWIEWGAPAAQTVAALAMIGSKLPFASFFEEFGDASYVLYLIHPALISVARAFANKGYLAPAGAPWLYLLAYIAICICASLLVHRFLEKPMTVAVRRGLLKGSK